MRIEYICAICLCMVIVAGMYAPLTQRFYDLYHSQRDVTTKRSQHLEPLHIALLSDLHSGTLYLDTLFKALEFAYRDKKLDCIVMSGDMIDDEENIDGAIAFFKRLNEAPFNKIPKFFVTGNHEFWSNQVLQYKNIVKEHQTFVLDSKVPALALRIKNRDVIIAGVDDPYVVKFNENGHFIHKQYSKDWQKQWESKLFLMFDNVQNFQDSLYKAYSFLNLGSFLWSQDYVVKREEVTVDFIVNAYKILLSHRPEFVDVYQQLPFHLVMSGHTHGGQVRIPFIVNGLYAPNQGIFPHYVGGMYPLEGTNRFDDVGTSFLVVSRGLSFNWILPRIYNPPEIVWIML